MTMTWEHLRLLILLRQAGIQVLSTGGNRRGRQLCRRGSDEQMFGAKQQVPHGGPSD
jgi:hypothetical protein